MSDSFFPSITGEKLRALKKRLRVAMTQRRQEERLRKAALSRLDNEDCDEEEEEEEEEDMTDEEEVGGCLCLLLLLALGLKLTSALLPERRRITGRRR